MRTPGRQAHWDSIHTTKDERTVSWYQERPDISLDLIAATGVTADAAIIDIGGGTSHLVDALLAEGFSAVTVLDLSEAALAAAKARLAAGNLAGRAANVRWVAADVTAWQPSHSYDVWHDRAALHFLTDPQDRAAYGERVSKAVRPGGHVIIGTFAPGGPERCSGLPVLRHDAASIGDVLGRAFELMESRAHDHRTPAGVVQRFQFSRFRRKQ